MEIEIDEQKIDEAVLALLYLTTLRTALLESMEKSQLGFS